MMFGEHDFLDRFPAARDAGFEAVEFLFPYQFSPEEIARSLTENDLAISVFNLYPGEWDKGDRGLAALADRKAEFRSTIQRAIPYARSSGAKQLHVMAGIADPSHETVGVYIENIRFAADALAAEGLDLLIEPINRRSMPGYFLSKTAQALDLMDRIDHPAVKLQFDIFHHQITAGDVLKTMSACKEQIGHIQIAGVPDRHEPDTGELNYAEIFRHIDNIAYSGWVGCEYVPRNGTKAGLDWL
ncbi:MAG: 2-oxo-tetronate isomerase, partial [Pseudomonadota bacterium]